MEASLWQEDQATMLDMLSKKEGIVMQILSTGTYYVGQVVLDRNKGTQTEFERYADNVISLYERGRMWLELVDKRECAMRKLITERYADNGNSLYNRGRMWLELVDKRECAMRKLITKEWICRQSKQY
jgi:hypothetical protein